jgi:hypothetical protein
LHAEERFALFHFARRGIIYICKRSIYRKPLSHESSQAIIWGITVTDKEKRECVDPGGNGVTMNKGAEGGPGPPGGE